MILGDLDEPHNPGGWFLMPMQQDLPYRWVAIHDDGSVVRQSNEEWSPLTQDASTVRVLRLEPLRAHLRPVSVEVDLEAGERFFHFRRKLMKWALSGSPELEHGFQVGENVVFVLGIERSDGTRVHMYVRPDGSVCLRSSDKGE